MEITVHKFEESKLSGFTLSTEFFFLTTYHSLSLQLSKWLAQVSLRIYRSL